MSSTAMGDVAFQTRSPVGLKASKTLLAKQKVEAWAGNAACTAF